MYTLKSFATVADKKTIKEVDTIKNIIEPYNLLTKNLYSGRNKAELVAKQIEQKFSCGEWATFKQWSDKGFRIKKGEHGVTVFCGFRAPKDDEEKKVPKFARVFNRDQVQAITDKMKEEYLTQ